MASDGTSDSASATGDDGDFVFQFRHDDSSTKPMDSSDKWQQLVEVVNSTDPGVAERLIIWPVRHEHDSVGVFGHITAVLVPIVDEQFDFEFLDQLRLGALGEKNDGIADAMFPEPSTSDLVDTVAITLIPVCNEDQLLLATQVVQNLPLFDRRQWIELFPKLGIVGDFQDTFRDDLLRQFGVSRKT